MNASSSPPSMLVVPSARVAAVLRRDHARRQRQQGLAVWQAPTCLGLGAWLVQATLPARSAGRLDPSFALLSQEQARVLWAEVIGEISGLEAAQADALARLMGDAEDTAFAWDLAGAWSASVGLTHEQALAREWRAAFRKRCGQLRVGTRTMLLEACARIGLDLSATGVSRGFDEAGPALRRLLPSPEASSKAVPRAVPSWRQWASVEEEFDAALDWAFDARAEGGETVAIVCPEPRAADGLVLRAARWLASSGVRTAIGGPAVLGSSVRAGMAPLVSHGLVALRAALASDMQRALHVADAIELLVSPFIRSARAEFAPRAKLAARLQRERVDPLTLALLAGIAREAECPVFAGLLETVQGLSGDVPRTQPMPAWIASFQQWLGAYGWPGEQALNAQEQAAQDAWSHALDTAAALDLVLSPQQSASAALARLRQAARGIGSAEAVAPDAIEILGIEEAAVVRPARAWVLGLHDAAWPSAPTANPLLPQSLLRRGGVPVADFARDAARARGALETLLAHAREIVLSHAAHEGDTPLRPSGALDWPALEIDTAPALGNRWRAPLTGIELERAPDDAPVPLPLQEATRQRGGVGVLAAQAACPFKAFAAYRLDAEGLDEAAPGLDPRERGELVHAVMAALWSDLKRSADAAELSPIELDEAIAAAVEAALRDRRDLPPRTRSLEARRLQRLAAQAVARDLQRAPFEVIAVEAQHELNLADLPLRLRIDRVDRLDGGALAIIDYKTGEAKRADWALPRPLAPQLLAYALVLDDAPIAAIAFAQLKPGDCKLVTEPAKDMGSPAGIAKLALLREAWRRELETLASGFVAGDARVDPRDGETTCRYCDFSGLCRVHERTLVAQDEEAGDES
jgi:ATP-dependent helicase/nuclease subunit B